ncbi:flagellar hook-length control protein FliK [Methylobacillus arboreus]|uniref:flagellar hook-length control protein FliK n=1 Tax=Methylobacillus arboreus TaxID=755170 RepID=UPI001E56B546|nr:flagellar hook-length control protein FliK [Methylobacillus arboreus]MCB5191871.1 flagellar hook-length control protein FliK [Methylobacillus arboreus]
MKTLPLSPVGIGNREFNTATQTIHAAEKEQWLQSLTNGQIIKGRILRQYSEGRYGVSFAGQERVVDSAIPLSVGDVLQGKVLGVSENSVSIRLLSGRAEQQPDAREQGEVGQQAHDVLDQAKASLSAVQRQAVLEVAARFADPDNAIQAGIFLAKLGLPVSRQAVEMVLKKLQADLPLASVGSLDELPELAFVAPNAKLPEQAVPDSEVIDTLQNFFIQHWQQQASLRGIGRDDDKFGLFAETSGEGADQREQPTLFSIFNTQTGANVLHRLHALPVMIDGQLREFDLALFDQQDSSSHEEVSSRRIQFNLQTEFGLVALDARIVNQHVSLQIAAQSSQMVEMLDDHVDTLKDNLKEAGWSLDHVENQFDAVMQQPARQIVEHVLAQDSLRMVI